MEKIKTYFPLPVFRLTIFIIIFPLILTAQLKKPALMAPQFPSYAEWLNTDRAYSIDEFKGKFVILDFWTYCCINCMHILPDLKRLEQTFPEELVVIGVHTPKFSGEKESRNIRQAILRYEIEHPVINDHQYELWQKYGVRAWPTVAIIDPEGYVLGNHSGEGVWDTLFPFLTEQIPDYREKGLLTKDAFIFRSESPVEAVLSFPGKILADPQNNFIYISDSNHNRILITNKITGEVKEIIGSGKVGKSNGDFSTAEFNHPQGITRHGDFLYIADTENHLIRTVDLNRERVTTLAGTGKQAQGFNQPGVGTAVALNSPWDLLYIEGKLYVAMAGFHQIWTIDVETAEAKPFAGSGREDITDGSATRSALAQPSGITTDGTYLYVADSEVSGIREISIETGDVKTIVGRGLFEFGDKDGNGKRVRLQHPLGITWANDRLFVADTYNNKIKVIHPDIKSSDTFAGSGEEGATDGLDATFDEPGGVSYSDGKLYVADTNNHAVRIVDIKSGSTATLNIKLP